MVKTVTVQQQVWASVRRGCHSSSAAPQALPAAAEPVQLRLLLLRPAVAAADAVAVAAADAVLRAATLPV